jgi:hypothetical protein
MTDTVLRDEITLANWRTHPHSRWSFQNACEMVPSAIISHGDGERPPAPPLPGLLNDILLEDPAGGRAAAGDVLARRHTDSLLVLRDGKPIAAWNAPHSDFDAPHLIFSVSKSITGLAAGIAQAEDRLDPDARITAYVPSMAPGTYGTARVRDLLDMTVDLAFDEDYLDHGGDFDRYRRAMLWNPERPDTRPETMEGFSPRCRPRAWPRLALSIMPRRTPTSWASCWSVRRAALSRLSARSVVAAARPCRPGLCHRRPRRHGACGRRHLPDGGRPRPHRPIAARRGARARRPSRSCRPAGSPTCAKTATARPGSMAISPTCSPRGATAPAGTMSATGGDDRGSRHSRTVSVGRSDEPRGSRAHRVAAAGQRRRGDPAGHRHDVGPGQGLLICTGIGHS